MDIETIKLSDLKEHPRNYKTHPEDQLQHIISSIEEHGFYRNIVIAKDNTILAGHGVFQACQLMNKEEVPVIRLNIDHDSTQALKVLTSDNEIQNLAKVDDRELSEILKDILDEDLDLTGTGFDQEQLSALIYTTRPSTEVADIDEAKEWVGMVDFEPTGKDIKVIIQFDNEEDKQEMLNRIGATHINKQIGNISTIWYPERKQEDLKSISFIADE
tara:strand:+ start:6705 stop:7352 length:648 start_codon:yes stop_codon:yes gene_type:complete